MQQSKSRAQTIQVYWLSMIQSKHAQMCNSPTFLLACRHCAGSMQLVSRTAPVQLQHSGPASESRLGRVSSSGCTSQRGDQCVSVSFSCTQGSTWRHRWYPYVWRRGQFLSQHALCFSHYMIYPWFPPTPYRNTVTSLISALPAKQRRKETKQSKTKHACKLLACNPKGCKSVLPSHYRVCDTSYVLTMITIITHFHTETKCYFCKKYKTNKK